MHKLIIHNIDRVMHRFLPQRSWRHQFMFHSVVNIIMHNLDIASVLGVDGPMHYKNFNCIPSKDVLTSALPGQHSIRLIGIRARRPIINATSISPHVISGQRLIVWRCSQILEDDHYYASECQRQAGDSPWAADEDESNSGALGLFSCKSTHVSRDMTSTW